MRIRHRGALLAIGLLACSGTTSEPDTCAGPIAIEVGSGTRPMVSWTPACGATTIMVIDASNAVALPLWTVFAAPGDIPPPIRYGSSPSGVLAIVGIDSLTIGGSYVVYVSRGLRAQPGAGSDSLRFVAR